MNLESSNVVVEFILSGCFEQYGIISRLCRIMQTKASVGFGVCFFGRVDSRSHFCSMDEPRGRLLAAFAFIIQVGC